MSALKDQFFKSRQEVEGWLGYYNIKKFIINDDLTVEVDGTVTFEQEDLLFLPVQFGSINGSFFISYNNLTSLAGCPREVSGNFSCHHNHLSSLQGGPKDVGGEFNCSYNQLIDLKGAPREVYHTFLCSSNKLEAFNGGPRFVGGDFVCGRNELRDFSSLPKQIGGSFFMRGNAFKTDPLKITAACKIGEKIYISEKYTDE